MKCILTLIVLLASFPVVYGQQLVSSLTEKWMDSSWQNYYTTSFAYYPDGTEALRTGQTFGTNGEWLNDARTVSVYDAQGRLEIASDIMWQGNEWINVVKRTYVYQDLTDKLLSITTAVWSDNEYHDFSRIVKTYDQLSGLLATDNIDLKDELSGNWLHHSSYDYSYNSTDEMDQMIYSLWDNLLLWIPARRYTFVYTASGDVQLNFGEEWVDNEWRNSRIQHFSYDTDEFLLSFVTEEWDNSSESWLNNLKLEYAYNNDGTLHQILTKNWNGSDWGNDYRMTNSYGTANLGVQENELSTVIFPNPAADQVTISFGQMVTATVLITNMEGKAVQSETISGMEQSLSVKELPAGVYLVNVLLQNGQLETHRIVKR